MYKIYINEDIPGMPCDACQHDMGAAIFLKMWRYLSDGCTCIMRSKTLVGKNPLGMQ